MNISFTCFHIYLEFYLSERISDVPRVIIAVKDIQTPSSYKMALKVCSQTSEIKDVSKKTGRKYEFHTLLLIVVYLILFCLFVFFFFFFLSLYHLYNALCSCLHHFFSRTILTSLASTVQDRKVQTAPNRAMSAEFFIEKFFLQATGNRQQLSELSSLLSCLFNVSICQFL